MRAEAIDLVETRLGQPAVIGKDHHDKPVWSSINRQPTPATELYLTPTGLAGDQATQTQLKLATDPAAGQIHGGRDKAVYVYPVEHYDQWLEELGEDGLAGRSLGENWRVSGLREADVRLGDIWELGEAQLMVSATLRTPCRTLNTYFGDQPMIQHMVRNGLCGWYMQVLRPGVVPTKGTIAVVGTNFPAPTVARAYNDKMRRRPGL